MHSSKVPGEQHGPEVHDDGPIDHLGDHGEVVLDQEDGRAALALHRAQDGGHLGRLVQVEPRRGLVGQQDLRLGRQRPGQLDQAAVPQPEGVDRGVGQVGDPHQLERGVDPLHLLLLRLAHVEEIPPEAPLALPRALRHHQVVAHRHVGEHLDPLVGAADAQPGPLVGRQAQQRPSVEDDVARLGSQLPADAVEQRRLAGAVRARPGRRSRRARRRR